MRLLNASISRLAGMLLALLCISSTSCDRLHEDLQPCVTGARLRFVYDYNMEFANAFPSQVDCLTLLVYDLDGNYIRTLTAGRPETADEDWRMVIDLPTGKYHLIAWGGIDCQDASFSFVSQPATTPMNGLKVKLNSSFVDPAHALHHLYYGALDIEIPPVGDDSEYVEDTVYMMKDTNDLRIMLANIDGTPADEADYDFSLITDNTLLDWDNNLLNAGETTYTPWTRGNAEFGINTIGLTATMAYAEISTSRFVYGNPTTLLITRRSDGYELIRIPLLNVLRQYKSERWGSMETQEFLDRQSYWPITFLLNEGDLNVSFRIVVDDWLVRYNFVD